MARHIFVLVAAKLSLDCFSFEPTVVKWIYAKDDHSPTTLLYSNGVLNQPTNVPRITVNNMPGQQQLVVSYVEHSDAGIYLCIGGNGEGQVLRYTVKTIGRSYYEQFHFLFI
jgi:hypothetical protein